jgi:hypothetical protein
MTIDTIGGLYARLCLAPDTEGTSGDSFAMADGGAETALYGEDAGAAEAPATEDGAEAEAPAPDEVPGDGRYDFTLPEGVELDKALADEAMPVLKEAGLTRDQANRMAGFLAQVRQREHSRVSEHWARTQGDWVRAVKTDREIGGENFSASVAASNRLIARHGTPELIDYLQSSGAGNNPEMVRFCTRIAAALSEDSPVSPEVPAGSRKTDHVDILYPTSRG